MFHNYCYHSYTQASFVSKLKIYLHTYFDKFDIVCIQINIPILLFLKKLADYLTLNFARLHGLQDCACSVSSKSRAEPLQHKLGRHRGTDNIYLSGIVFEPTTGPQPLFHGPLI